MGKNINCQTCPVISLFCLFFDFTHVITESGQTKQTTFLIQQVIKLINVKITAAQQ